MKRKCFQSLPKNTDIKNAAYNIYIQNIQRRLNYLQALKFPDSPIQKLQQYKQISHQILSILKKIKSLRQLKKKHAIPIYQFYLQEQLRSLNSIKKITDINIKILKAVKSRVNIPNGKGETKQNQVKIGMIDWKQLWERICQECPETSYNSSPIRELMKTIKKHFSEDNAMEVWQYFRKANKTAAEKKIGKMFTRITKNTSKQIFQEYLMKILEEYKLNKISAIQFIMKFLSATKLRKIQNNTEEDGKFCKMIYSHINDAAIEAFTSIGTDKKKGTEVLKINKQLASFLSSLIGKSNHEGSIYILNHVFSLIKKMLKPLESNANCVNFLYNFFKSFYQRLEKENQNRESLKKIIKKIQEKKEENKDEDDDDEEDQDNNQEKQDDEEEIQSKMELLTGDLFEFEEEEQEQEQQLALGTDEEKKGKLQAQLSNEVTSDMINLIRDYLEGGIFEIIYYVISKKFVPHILKYIYRIFPDLSIKSLDVLEKASQISNINEEALIKNIIVGAESMLTPNNLLLRSQNHDKQDNTNYVNSVKQLMRVLEKAYNTRKILDVWALYETITSKIPLLDEKDMQKISEEDKELFRQTFGLNHDRFYEDYSEHILQAFKRFLREGEFVEKKDQKKYVHSISQLYCNSYTFMRKRLLDEVMEIITEKPNMIAINCFMQSQSSKNQEQILKNQLESINIESQQSKQIKQQLVYALSKKLSLEQLKPWIRKLAGEKNYEPIKLYLLFNVGESIEWQPLPSTLQFLHCEQKIEVSFSLSADQVKENLKELFNYQNQLLTQIEGLVEQIGEKSKCSSSENYVDQIIDTYNNTEKIKFHKPRKIIYQILSIISYINSAMQPYVLTIKQNKSKKIEMIPSGVKPLKLDESSEKGCFIASLLSHKQILNDPNITQILTSLITNEYYMAEDMMDQQNRKIQRQKLKNKSHQLPGYVNRIRQGNQYISKTRIYMGGHLNAKQYSEPIQFDKQVLVQFFKLLSANGNQTIKDLMSMFKEKKDVRILKELTLQLANKNIENRILIKRIGEIIQYLVKQQAKFTNEQIIFLIDYHAKFLQSHDHKIRQNANKSLKKTVKVFDYHPINKAMHSMMEKYLKIQKMELIWLIYATILLGNRTLKADPPSYRENYLYFKAKVEGLLLDDSRSIRRIALYLYSIIIRSLKKIHITHETVEFENKLEQKNFEDFLQTGFIRPQFYKKQLKDWERHKQIPLASYTVKKVENFQYNFFEFLIDNEGNALKFIKHFHSDMIASIQMLSSAIQSSMMTIDLFSVASKALESIFFYTKTRDLTNSRIQTAVGSRFFKYLCIEDSLKGFKFFRAVRGEVEKCLTNLQNLDNQTLILIFSLNLLNAYQNSFKERIADIEQFLSKILKQIIDKSSGPIFKKFIKLFFGKPRRKQGIEFLREMVETMINQKSKVSRAGQILINLENKTLQSQEKILRIILNHKIDLQNVFIIALLNDILLYPENNPIHIQDIQDSGIISLNSCIQQRKIIRLTDKHCLINIESIHKFIIGQIVKIINTQQTEQIKTAFSLINSLLQICNVAVICEANVNLLTEIIHLGIKIANEKSQLQLEDLNHFKKILTQIMSKKYPKKSFEKLFMAVVTNIDPNIKKTLDFLHSLVASPINIVELPEQIAQSFISKLFEFEKKASSFKEILILLSTFFTYSKISKNQLQQIIQVSHETKDQIKKKTIILYQAYVLANNIDLDPEVIKEIMKGGSYQRDKRNIWAREMLLQRGRRQYFDNEECYDVWREIKEISNPYHYIA